VCAGHVSSMWGDVVESVPLFLFFLRSTLPLGPPPSTRVWSIHHHVRP
jgi:hypothetical protein